MEIFKLIEGWINKHREGHGPLASGIVIATIRLRRQGRDEQQTADYMKDHGMEQKGGFRESNSGPLPP